MDDATNFVRCLCPQDFSFQGLFSMGRKGFHEVCASQGPQLMGWQMNGIASGYYRALDSCVEWAGVTEWSVQLI